MLNISPEISGASIVLRGNFNPQIFSPSWFEKVGIFSADQTKACDKVVVHDEITAFALDWITINVQKNQFSASTSFAPTSQISDFVVRTFGEFLIHTPVNAMGINRQAHFRVGSEEVRNTIGKILAPHEPWGEWGQKIEGGPGVERGGMLSLTMVQNKLEHRDNGKIMVKIEPSRKLENADDGIFMEVNDHYAVADAEKSIGCEEMIEILAADFDRSQEMSDTIINGIMDMSKNVSSA